MIIKEIQRLTLSNKTISYIRSNLYLLGKSIDIE